MVRLVVLRAIAGPRDMPERATTRRPVVFVDGMTPARADVVDCDTCGVILRLVVFVAVRCVFVGRGTTRLSADNFVVLTTVFIGFNDWDVVTPGFKLVRI